MNIERQYIQKLMNESVDDISINLPSRVSKSYQRRPRLTRRTYPMTFKILDFLGLNGYPETKCMRAFLKNEKWMVLYDYNRNRETIDPMGGNINFEWIEEYPEKAIERLWTKNQNLFQKDYASFEEFKNALIGTKQTIRNVYFIEFKKEVPIEKEIYRHSSEADALMKPYKEKILSVLKDLQSEYGLSLTPEASFFRIGLQMHHDKCTISPSCELDVTIQRQKREKRYYQEIFKDIENTLKQKLPEYDIINTGQGSYYMY